MEDYNKLGLWANVFQQNHAEIRGRNVWHYLIDSGIGQINIIEFEMPGRELSRKIFDGNYEKAEKYFENTCRKILGGKI